MNIEGPANTAAGEHRVRRCTKHVCVPLRIGGSMGAAGFSEVFAASLRESA